MLRSPAEVVLFSGYLNISFSCWKIPWWLQTSWAAKEVKAISCHCLSLFQNMQSPWAKGPFEWLWLLTLPFIFSLCVNLNWSLLLSFVACGNSLESWIYQDIGNRESWKHVKNCNDKVGNRFFWCSEMKSLPHAPNMSA